LRRLKTLRTAEFLGAFELNTLQHPRDNRYLRVLSMIAARGMPPEIFPGDGAPHKALIPVPDRIGLATTAELDCCKLTEAPQMPRASDLRY
jgi:hypothetical protein